jgi:hypothetical protein
MEFTCKLTGLSEALQKDLNPQNVLLAGKRSIVRAANSGKTIISDQIRGRWNIRKSDLDRKIYVDLKNINNMEATLTLTGEPISLIYFDPVEIKGGRRLSFKRNKGGTMPGLIGSQTRLKSGGGVTVKIIKRKTAKLRPAFIATGKGGTPMVFRRIPGSQSSNTYTSKSGKTVKREKLIAYKVVTYASILKQPGNMEVVINRIDEQLVKEWKSNLAHYTEGQ